MAKQHRNKSSIEWVEWGQAAFDRAVEADKPVFLYFYTIWGYPSHRFERETLADPTVQQLVNGQFVPMRVDVTRRPDIFLRYNPGGWPSICLLTPTGELLLGRTLLGIGSMTEALQQVAEYYRANKQEIRRKIEQAGEPPNNILSNEAGPEQVDRTPLAEADTILKASYDRRFKGFGRAPKYPLPGVLSYLLEQPDPDNRAMALDMLETMQDSALHDYIDGGFFRLCTDEGWRVPQFEKLLEDNAALLGVYLEAWRLTREEAYRDIAEEIVQFLESRLGDEETGLFFSALDSEGRDAERGGYYGWTEDELRAHLDESVAEVVIERYGISSLNAPRELLGRSALELRTPVRQVATRMGMDESLVLSMIADGLRSMKAYRDQRLEPALDGALFSGAMGQTLEPLAKAAILLDRPRVLQRAFEVADLVWDKARRQEGCLRHIIDEEDSSVLLDDQVDMILGLLGLYCHAGRAKDAIRAHRLARETLELFGDDGSPGCWDRLPEQDAPGALSMQVMPFEGNSRLLLACVELGALTGESLWKTRAVLLADALKEQARRYQLHNATYLKAVSRMLATPVTIDLVMGEDIGEFRREIVRGVSMGTRIRLLDPDQEIPWASADHGNGADGRAFAIVQIGNEPRQTLHTPGDVLELLDSYPAVV